MIDNDIDPFAKGLDAIMKERSLKPAPLSEMAGLGVSAIRDMFRKGGSPRLSTASSISRALGMSIDEVIAAGSGAGFRHAAQSDSVDAPPARSGLQRRSKRR